MLMVNYGSLFPPKNKKIKKVNASLYDMILTYFLRIVRYKLANCEYFFSQF